PPRVTLIRRDLPSAVDDVIVRALAKCPDERFPSAAGLADALRAALGLDPYDPSRASHPPIPTLPVTMLDAASAPSAPSPRPAAPPAPATWTAVVTVDRAYYDSVSAVNDSDTASISFPGDIPERRIPLSGAEVRIGRRSKSLGILPEIALSVPSRAPGVSRLHAKLIPAPDGTWTVVDLGTDN